MSDTHPDPESMTQPALPAGTLMGDFELRGVLGAGGFGIVYNGYDRALNRRVAIKEYMPAFLAGRTPNGQITLLSRSNAPTFEAGMRSFIDEARLLASLDHPSLVKVYQFWKSNGTAYFAMPFYEGHTLTHHRRVLRTPFTEKRVRELLDAMLGALEVLHEQHIYHRDVAPDNILLVGGRRPLLLDFGSARRTIAGQTQRLTAVIKLGYAPIEQYDDTRPGVQGPWTDLYALGGTLYFLITGRAPPAAQIRALNDDLNPLAEQGADGFSTGFLRIVDSMLTLRPAERPQNVAQLRQALARSDEPDTVSTHIDLDTTADAPADDPMLATLAADRTRSWVGPARVSNRPAAAAAQASRRSLAWGVALLVLAGAGGAAAWLGVRDDKPAAAQALAPPPAASAASVASATMAAASAAASAAALVAVASEAPAVASAAPEKPASSAAAASGPAGSAPVARPESAVTAAPASAVATTPTVRTPKPAAPPALAQQPASPGAADRARAADTGYRLSPEMAAALARAQAAQMVISSQGSAATPGSAGADPPRRDPPETAAAAGTDTADSADSAAPAGGMTSSPLARCRREQAQVPQRVCLESLCGLPDYRFHAVCVRLQRESAERQRPAGR